MRSRHKRMVLFRWDHALKSASKRAKEWETEWKNCDASLVDPEKCPSAHLSSLISMCFCCLVASYYCFVFAFSLSQFYTIEKVHSNFSVYWALLYLQSIVFLRSSGARAHKRNKCEEKNKKISKFKIEKHTKLPLFVGSSRN